RLGHVVVSDAAPGLHCQGLAIRRPGQTSTVNSRNLRQVGQLLSALNIPQRGCTLSRIADCQSFAVWRQGERSDVRGFLVSVAALAGVHVPDADTSAFSLTRG